MASFRKSQLKIMNALKGNIETVSIGVCGEVYSLEVQKGDRVIPGMVLAFIKEDLIGCESD
jgi:biotin carboxyl carrier protein